MLKKCIGLIMIAALAIPLFAAGAKIKNVTNNTIFVNVDNGRTVGLAPGKEVAVNDKDLKHANMQKLIKKGSVIVVGN